MVCLGNICKNTLHKGDDDDDDNNDDDNNNNNNNNDGNNNNNKNNNLYNWQMKYVLCGSKMQPN